MQKSETKDFLIRNMPIALYNQLTEAAKQHQRSRTQEALVALSNGLQNKPRALQEPQPFKWGKKLKARFIDEAINEGRE